MFGLFDRKPNTTLIERYEASLASKDETIGRVCEERDAANRIAADLRTRYDVAVKLGISREGTLQRVVAERDAALAELAPLKAAHAKQIANLTAANERRRAAKAAAALPDGMYDKDGRPHFDCGACGSATPWEGDVSDFRAGDYTNLCGGSPRCCP